MQEHEGRINFDPFEDDPARIEQQAFEQMVDAGLPHEIAANWAVGVRDQIMAHINNAIERQKLLERCWKAERRIGIWRAVAVGAALGLTLNVGSALWPHAGLIISLISLAIVAVGFLILAAMAVIGRFQGGLMNRLKWSKPSAKALWNSARKRGI